MTDDNDVHESNPPDNDPANTQSDNSSSNEVQTQEKFELNHSSGLNVLEKLRLKFRKLDTPELAALDKTLLDALERVYSRIPKNGNQEPEEVLRRVIDSLPEIDAQRMVIDNLLESLKRNEELSNTIRQYQELGLLLDEKTENTPNQSTKNLGKEINKRKKFWTWVGSTVMQLGVNALKTIAKFGQVEPIITIAPVPGLSFALKGKGMSFYDLYSNLFENIFSNSEK